MANMTYTETGYQHSSQLNLVARVKMTVLTWLERSRSRRQLSELPEYLLKDIGLNEADRYQETTKPFWRGCSTWHGCLVFLLSRLLFCPCGDQPPGLSLSVLSSPRFPPLFIDPFSFHIYSISLLPLLSSFDCYQTCIVNV